MSTSIVFFKKLRHKSECYKQGGELVTVQELPGFVGL